MILVIDAGNTNITFALMKGEEVIHSWRHVTGEALDTAVISAGLKKSGETPEGLEGGILASVVPGVSEELQQIFAAVCGQPLMVAGTGNVSLGIKNKTDAPGQVGIDRLINAVAAAHFFGPPLIVIDIGTATTFDVVGTDGAFRGGVICAGANLGLKALHQQTAQLPDISVYEPDWVAGKNTVDAMQSGAFFGTLSQIEGLVKRLRAELGGKVKTVATGGLAGTFVGKTEAIDHHHPELILQGLRLVYERNSGRAE